MYKSRGQFRRLGQLAKAHSLLRGDTTRVKNRIKSVLRSRGIAYGAGPGLFAKRDRGQWLSRLPESSRTLAELPYEEHDAVMALRAKAEKAMLAEARRHREWRLVQTCGSGSDPDSTAAAGPGDPVAVQEPE